MSCQPRYPHRERCFQPWTRSSTARRQLRAPATTGVGVSARTDDDMVVNGTRAGNGPRARGTAVRGTAAGCWPSEVLAGVPAEALGHAVLAGPGRQPPPHLLQLLASGHLLREQGGLEAVKDTLQPADQLRLRDPQLTLRGNALLGEGQAQPVELLAELRGQTLLQLLDRILVDLAQAVAGGLVQRCRADLLEQLLDHRADAHDLGRLLHHVGEAARMRLVLVRAPGHPRHPDRPPVRADDHHLLVPVLAVLSWVAHASHPGLDTAVRRIRDGWTLINLSWSLPYGDGLRRGSGTRNDPRHR